MSSGVKRNSVFIQATVVSVLNLALMHAVLVPSDPFTPVCVEFSGVVFEGFVPGFVPLFVSGVVGEVPFSGVLVPVSCVFPGLPLSETFCEGVFSVPAVCVSVD